MIITTGRTLGTAVAIDTGGLAISPPGLTSDTDDWNPSQLISAGVVRVNSTGSYSLTGIVAPSPAVHKSLMLWNISTKTLIIKHNDFNSVSYSRFLNSRNKDIKFYPNNIIWVVYDVASMRWRSIGNGVGF